MKIILGDFNAKVGRENIFKPTIGNESLHQDDNNNNNNNNNNSVRIVHLATSKNLVVKTTIFPHLKFISTPGALLMGRLTTRLLTS